MVASTKKRRTIWQSGHAYPLNCVDLDVRCAVPSCTTTPSRGVLELETVLAPFLICTYIGAHNPTSQKSDLCVGPSRTLECGTRGTPVPSCTPTSGANHVTTCQFGSSAAPRRLELEGLLRTPSVPERLQDRVQEALEPHQEAHEHSPHAWRAIGASRV